MGNMIVIALVLDERRKQKQKIKEIEEKNNFDPLVSTGQKNPYLVDQHLLEKENA